VDALTTFNLTASVVLLSVASFMDLVRREVDDWVWLLLASVTGPLTLFRTLLYFDTGYPLLVLISIAFSSSVAYLFYRFELYGGADAKAIVALSLAYPVNLHGRAVHPIAPIGVLLNALILSLIIPVALFMFNAYRVLVRREDILSDLAGAPLRVRLAALFLGTRVSSPQEVLGSYGKGRGGRSCSDIALTVVHQLLRRRETK
jgi:Type IV leader peptidase family.